ncbi:MAG: helix-turn-helix transcriptional regulator [Clostridia bacterium]|nr:helix-turn-helix transcriptional regulator [Clostridia bacterium]
MDIRLLSEIKPNIKTFIDGSGWDFSRGKYPEKRPSGVSCDTFLYVVFGKAVYHFGEYALSVNEGDLVFLARDCPYELEVLSEKCGVVYANFLFDLPEGILLKSEAVVPPGRKNVEYAIRRIITAWRIQTPTMNADCLSLLYAVYSDFLKTNTAEYLHFQKHRRMAKAKEYIDAHITSPELSVKAIADVFKMSESHFRYSFKSMHNLSPAQYIQQQRICLAKALLRDTDDSMTRIAESLGYSSIYYFSDAFKKEIKCSPSEYRKRVQTDRIK